MTTIKEWSDRGEAMRAAARRLRTQAKALENEALYFYETAAACDKEAARMLTESLETDHV